MAKFGINDLIDIRDRESEAGTAKEYQEIWLSPYDVKPSESNFYSKEKIEELADSFLAVGQQQPTVLARVDGEFRIVSGHRRNLANIRNLERGHEEYRKIRYLYKDMTPAMLELSLLIGNAYNRELTAWEKTQQAQKLKEALVRARDEDGLEIPGKLRDVVADIMNESSSGIARMESIHKNAGPEIQEEFRKGNLSISAAYEAAKLPAGEQKEVARKAASEGSVKIKEIAERVMKNQGEKSAKRDQGFSVVSNLDTGLQAETDDKELGRGSAEGETGERQPKKNIGDGNIRPFKRGSRHKRILQEWSAESIELTAVSKSVMNAIQKVSDKDTAKTDWADIEWAAFLAKTIMNLSDCVSEEDLYLLHDIMIRCRERQQDIR